VQAVLSRFPGAEIVGVRARDEPPPAPSGNPDEPAAEPPVDDDTPAFGEHRAPDDVDDDF